MTSTVDPIPLLVNAPSRSIHGRHVACTILFMFTCLAGACIAFKEYLFSCIVMGLGVLISASIYVVAV